MEEYVYYNALFDIYGVLLTEKEQMTFKDYYQEDMSFGEIAEDKNISRAAVAKMVKTLLDKLKYYEDSLHFYEKTKKLNDILNCQDINEIKGKIKEILEEN